jgi:CHASE3 domain sensor protein
VGTEWTVSTLHEHLIQVLTERDHRYEQRFADLEKSLTVALAASEKAILKAEGATERRFDAVNEFRATLSDQANQFVTRAENNAMALRTTERLDELTSRVTRSEGRGAGLNAGWVYLLAGIAAVGTIISVYLALIT